jgi:hypothetical protein
VCFVDGFVRLSWPMPGSRTAAVGVSAFVLLAVPGGGLAASPNSTKLCTRAMTAASVLEFVTAFNAGDRRRLNRVFADAPMFKWYSVTRSPPHDHFVAHSKAALLPYFAERRARNEGQAITHFRYGGTSRTPVGNRAYLVGNFTYRLLRWADDIGAGRPEMYVGKGVVSCTSRGARLMVWSIGTPSVPGT